MNPFTTSSSRGAHVRIRARRRVTTGLVAALVATSGAVTAVLASGQNAQAANEVPGSETLDLSNISATFGPGVLNNSDTNRTTDENTGNREKLYYGITHDTSDTNIVQSDTALTSTSDYITSAQATANNDWTYIARGEPWMWNGGNGGVAAADRRMGVINNLRVDGQSAIGFKPNNPGAAVPANSTFLLGTIRHNNYTISSPGVIRYLHSDLRLNIGNGGTEVQIPWTNYESSNDSYTTLRPRAGGAYEIVADTVCTDNLSGSALNGPSMTERKLVGGRFTGVALLQARNTNGSVNTENWKCVQHVGTGNGSYDLYNRMQGGPNLWTLAELQNYIASNPKGSPNAIVDGGWDGEQILGENDWPDAIDVSRRLPESDDTITLDNAAHNTVLNQNGKTYRFELDGFVPSDDGTCPVAMPESATRTTTFTSKEAQVSYGCLYARFSEERTITLQKTEIDPTGANPALVPASFNVTTGANYDPLTGKTPLTTSAPYVTTGSFPTALTPTALGTAGTVTAPERYSFQVGNSDITISEAAQGGNWTLSDVQCVNGAGDTVDVTRTADGISLANVGAAPNAAASPITCNFINQHNAEKMKVEKTLVTNGATGGATTFNVDYKITATNEGTADGNTGVLTDLPEFAHGLNINYARIADTQADLNGASNLYGSGPYQITAGDHIAAGASKDYWIRFNVTIDTTNVQYNAADLTCETTPAGVRTAGKGLFNSVSAETGKDSDGDANNKDCGDVPTPGNPTIRVQKELYSNTFSGAAANQLGVGAAQAVANTRLNGEVDYRIIVQNTSGVPAQTGILTDKPEFAPGLIINSARIAQSQGDLSTASPVTAGPNGYVLVDAPGATLAPYASKEYWIRFNVTIDNTVTGYNADDLTCQTVGGVRVAGKGLFNAVNVETGKDTDGDANNKACGDVPPPAPPSMSVEKNLWRNGFAPAAANQLGVGAAQAATATLNADVEYRILVRNTGGFPINTGAVYDKPQFATGLVINSARVATASGNLDAAPVVTAGPAGYEVIAAPGVTLAPGEYKEYWIRFNVSIDTTANGYNSNDLACQIVGGVRVAGKGLFNEVNVEAGKDSDGDVNNKACGDVPVPPAPSMRVEKSLFSNPFEGNAANQLGVNAVHTAAATPTSGDVDYRIVVVNTGRVPVNTGVLTDKPDFPAGLVINSVRIADNQGNLSMASPATAGPDGYVLTSGEMLPVGATRVYWVRVNVTVDNTVTGYNPDDLTCQTVGGVRTPGKGLFNEVNVETGKDSDGDVNNKACGNVPPLPIPGRIQVAKTLITNGATSGDATFDVDYKITAENIGGLALGTGVLTDMPAFTAGLTINNVKVADSQANLAAAPVVTAGPAGYQLTAGDNLAAGAFKEYWIRFNVTLDTTAAGYSSTNLVCELDVNGLPTAGKGLFNEVNAENGKDTDGHNNNLACDDVPTPGAIQVEKTLVTNGATATASTFDVDYRVTATNVGDQPTTTGALTDKPDFAPGLTIDAVKIASTQADLVTAVDATPDASGAYELVGAPGDTLAAGASKDYWIRFTVTLDRTAAGFNEADLACEANASGVPTAGKGLFNEVNAENGKDVDGHDNNLACGDVPTPKPGNIRVAKTIEANGASATQTTFNVDYKIVATNDGDLPTTTGALTDKPDFAPGLVINGVRIASTQAGLDSAAPAAANANGAYELVGAPGDTLAGGASQEYWIRFNVTLETTAAGYNASALTCTPANGVPTPGAGLYNVVTTETGKDSDGTDNNAACGDVPTPGTSLAKTGATIMGAFGAMALLLAGGAGAMILARKRREEDAA